MMTTCSHCGGALGEETIRCPDCFELNAPRLTTAINRYYDESMEVNSPDSDTHRKRETFHEKVKLVFPRVEAVARAGRIAKQSELWGDGVDSWAMKHYLGAVSSIEHWDGRPLLSSVIINAKRGFPADGYFGLVESLGISEGITERTESEKQSWWEDELADVHSVWESR